MGWRTKPSVPVVLAWGVLAACAPDEPAPALVDDREALLAPPSKPPRTGPFRNPNVDPPGARAEPQLEQEQLQQALEQAELQARAGEIHHAITTLRQCANKIPQSVRCEAELGMLMAQHDLYRAHAQYFLDEASKIDDAQVEDSVYRRLAEVAWRRARFETAAAAIGVLIERKRATARDYARLASALQSDPARLEEAIAAYEEAYQRDPSQHAWLHKQALLYAQRGDTQAAIERLERYRVAVGPGRTDSAVSSKIAELRERLKHRASTP